MSEQGVMVIAVLVLVVVVLFAIVKASRNANRPKSGTGLNGR